MAKYGLSLSIEDLLGRKSDLYKELLGEVKPQVGLEELLNFLQAENYKMAIASSSQLEEIKTIANNLKVNSYFDGYFSAEQVGNGKPAPDVYLLAAKKLGVKPEECLVLEDAPKGVQAGKTAKMLCFAIPSENTKNGDFSLADRVLNSLSEVFNEIVN